MNALEVLGAWKSFYGHRALRGFNLVVPRGAIYVLVGKTGSGKTTALGVGCGLIPLDAGKVRVFGKVLRESGARVGATVGGSGMLKGMSVRDNVQTKAIALGVAEVNTACDELIGDLEMEDFADEQTQRLSPSGVIWLSFALALIGSPDLLLLDDPLAGLDPHGRARMLRLLSDLSAKRGSSVLIAAQETAPFSTIASRFGILADGALVREIAAEDLDAACRSVVCVRTDGPERTLAQLEAVFPTSNVRMRNDGRIELSCVDTDDVSRALFTMPERLIELSEQKRSADEIVANIAKGGR